MNWREKLQVQVSKLEDMVHIELANRGLHKLLRVRGTVVLFTPEPTLIPMENVTKKIIELESLYTIPDFLFDLPGFHLLPVYLDGPPHKKRGVKNRDDTINALWDHAGYPAKRFKYETASKPLAKRIVDEIEVELRKWFSNNAY